MSNIINDHKDIWQDLTFATENIDDCNTWKEFSKRVSSFLNVESHWRLKPFSLSPPVCAQFGWKCIGKDLIQCSACNEIICGKLPVLWNSNVYDECVNAITTSLQTSHKKYCPWPIAPCPDYFVQIEPINKKQAFQEFMTRLQTLLEIKEDLPLIKNETLETDITENDLVSLSQSSVKELDAFTRSAIILALIGWRKGQSEKKCLWCCHCQRLLELQFYKTAKLKEDSSLDKKIDNADSSNISKDKFSNSVQSTKNDNSDNTESPNNIKSETKDNLEELNDKDNTTCIKKDHSEDDKEGNDHLSKTDEPPKKILKVDIKGVFNYFDPVYEHRYWCMWISSTNVTKSPNNAGMRGWQIFLKSLMLNVRSSTVSSKCVASPQKIKKIHEM